MTTVTKHDRKQEWKSDDCEQSWWKEKTEQLEVSPKYSGTCIQLLVTDTCRTLGFKFE